MAAFCRVRTSRTPPPLCSVTVACSSLSTGTAKLLPGAGSSALRLLENSLFRSVILSVRSIGRIVCRFEIEKPNIDAVLESDTPETDLCLSEPEIPERFVRFSVRCCSVGHVTVRET